MGKKSKYDYVQPSLLEERDGLSGVVKLFDTCRGFGFVTLGKEDGGGDVFLHLKEMRGNFKPKAGQTVEFDTRWRSHEKDALRAVDVTAAGERQKELVAQLVKEGRSAPQERAFTTVEETTASLPSGLITAKEMRERLQSNKRSSADAGETGAGGEEGGNRAQGAEAEDAEQPPQKKKKKKDKKKSGGLSFEMEDGDDC